MYSSYFLCLSYSQHCCWCIKGTVYWLPSFDLVHSQRKILYCWIQSYTIYCEALTKFLMSCLGRTFYYLIPSQSELSHLISSLSQHFTILFLYSFSFIQPWNEISTGLDSSIVTRFKFITLVWKISLKFLFLQCENNTVWSLRPGTLAVFPGVQKSQLARRQTFSMYSLGCTFTFRECYQRHKIHFKVLHLLFVLHFKLLSFGCTLLCSAVH